MPGPEDSLLSEAGWEDLPGLVAREFEQACQEGKDPGALRRLRGEFARSREDPLALEDLHRRLLLLPLAKGFPFVEPSDLETIQRLRPAGGKTFLRPDRDRLRDQLHGAWLGRCCGCALGKPVENFTPPRDETLSSRERIRRYLTAISPGEWPVAGYIPGSSPAAAETGQVTCPDSTRERIGFMEPDDDIRYTVLAQILLMESGAHFGTADVAANWLRRLPYQSVCTAETQAYRNLVALGAFRLETSCRAEIDWPTIASRLNPYREWIGAQIRADSYAYAAPANPSLAAEFAWRDARLSHTKNGIYAAMYCAAMISAAFAANDPEEIVEAGLSQIPETSRLSADIRTTLSICRKSACNPAAFETVFDEIHSTFARYDPVHSINNAAICTAALLLSGGDFHLGITLAVMGGWDTDCNAATTGSIVGILSGARNAPPFWTEPLNDTLLSAIPGYHPIPISECAARSLAIAESMPQGNSPARSDCAPNPKIF